MKVWDLRKQKDVVIPDGVEKIGSYWFWDTDVENVLVPASVRELGIDAFHGCEKLKSVTFAEGSRLETIRRGCF